MGFSLSSLRRFACLLACISLLPIGRAQAQVGPIKPQPLPGGPVPPIPVPGFTPTPPKPTVPVKPFENKPGTPGTPLYTGPAPGSRGSLEAGLTLFQGSPTFRFRWTERRDPRGLGGFENLEYRRLTCQGEAQRYADSLRMRFTVSMETDTGTDYSEWIVLGTGEGGRRFHRKGTEGPWTEITNATPWLTEMSSSLRIQSVWQGTDMYPAYLYPTRTANGQWNTYHFTANKTRDAYYIYIDCAFGQINQVTHRSTAENLPYTINRTIDYWGYNLFSEITAPKPGETGPLPIPATYPIIDRRLPAP